MVPCRTVVIIVTLCAVLAAVSGQTHQDGSHNQGRGPHQGRFRFRRSADDNGVGNGIQENEHKETDEKGLHQSEQNYEARENKENLSIFTTKTTNQDGQAAVEVQINQNHQEQEAQVQINENGQKVDYEGVEERHKDDQDTKTTYQSVKNYGAQEDKENLLILTTKTDNQDGQAVEEVQINQNRQEQEAHVQINENSQKVDYAGVEEQQDVQQTQTTRNPYKPLWTTCNFTVDPILSCADCFTRVICKPIGALVKPCYNPYRPFCFNGICSPVPGPECFRQY